MKVLLIACVFTVLGFQAHADDWPDHGFYRVRDGVDHGRRYCELLGELNVNGVIFAIVIRQNASGSLMTQFMTQVHGIDKATEVIVGIDGKEMFRFTPQVRKDEPELPSVAAFFSPVAGSPIIEQLRKSAKGAQRFQVVALPSYKMGVPADGLAEAMDDLIACRTSKGI